MSIKRYTVEIDGKQTEVVIATEHETSLANSVSKGTRLEEELKAAKAQNAEGETFKARVTTLETENAALTEKHTAAERKMKLIVTMADTVSAEAMEDLLDLKMFREAKLDTPEDIAALKTAFTTRFPQFAPAQGAAEGAGEAGGTAPVKKALTPAGGTPAGAGAGGKVITNVTDFKGMTPEQINANWPSK